MSDNGMYRPYRLGEIRNFAWVQSPWVARGEQPPLSESSYRALTRAGIQTVLSLRVDGEKESDVTGRWYPRYSAEDERAVCKAVGLRFGNVECCDWSAPSPEQVEAVLRFLADETGAGRAVFVHCLGGVGRTGVMAGAWHMASGGRGEEAVERYVLFFSELLQELGFAAEAQQASAFKGAGIPQQVWVLGAVARALGRPIAELHPLVTPQRPSDSDGWDGEYEKRLKRWREESVPRS